MRIILRRRIRIPDDHQAVYRQQVFKLARLRIGGAANQHIHIEHPEVAAKHAVLSLERGCLRVRALGANRVNVNGKPIRTVILQVSDVMTFGSSRLTFEQRLADGVIVLRLNDPQALSTARAKSSAERSLKGAGLSARSYSWYLVLALLTLGFLAPLASALVSSIRPVVREAALLPSDVVWQPGALHAGHQALGHDCNACHKAAFKRVTDEACATCHHSVHQHVQNASLQQSAFGGSHCIDCHLEHDAQKELVNRDTAQCTSCHADLRATVPRTRIKNVGSFSASHPEFALSLLLPAGNDAGRQTVSISGEQRESARQASNLVFSHKVHLDPKGIDSPTGRRQLQCAACHSTDASGRFMLPIRMQAHCADCHTLQFDEHDPGSKVPHGDLAAVFTALREHFSRAYLEQNLGADPLAAARRRPGSENALLSRDEQRRARTWADGQTERAARELLDKRTCVQCHQIDKLPGVAIGPESWRVAPVRLTDRWFPNARFDHAKHQTATCESCHAHIQDADDSGAIHMPGIAACRSCHGDTENQKVASTCLTCHGFHRPENALLTGNAPRSEGKGRP